MKMTLNSIYSLVLAVPKGNSPLSHVLPEETFVCGFVKNEPTLRFLSCNTRKYNNDNDDDVEVWTILSSPSFANKHKAPQEFLSPETVADVTSLMLNAVERSLDITKGSLADKVLESRLQLWGAAVPLNVWTTNSEKEKDPSSTTTDGFIYDAEFGVGVCGDWLLEPSIAGAWESGRRLASHLTETKKNAAMGSVGLSADGKFQVSIGSSKEGIGAFR
jgi:predicted NAD/FAD-dependent oxidoreductase